MPGVREHLMVTEGYEQLCHYIYNKGFRLEGMGRNETLETLCKEVEEEGINIDARWTRENMPACRIVDMFTWKDQKRGQDFWFKLHQDTYKRFGL